MATKFRKIGENGNQIEAAKTYSVKAQDIKTRFYCSSDDLEREWRKFQRNVRRRNPIVRRILNSVRALADDLQLEPQVVEFLEDSFRGFSPKMQFSMFDTLRVYICNGDLPSTGVAHADRLVREMLSRIYNNK